MVPRFSQQDLVLYAPAFAHLTEQTFEARVFRLIAVVPESPRDAASMHLRCKVLEEVVFWVRTEATLRVKKHVMRC